MQRNGADLFFDQFATLKASTEGGFRYALDEKQDRNRDGFIFSDNALQRGQLTGTDRFVGEVASIVGSQIEKQGPGRPKREPGK